MTRTTAGTLLIEQQTIGRAFIPTHKFTANFLEYYEEYVNLNTRRGNLPQWHTSNQPKPGQKKAFLFGIRMIKTSPYLNRAYRGQ